jgi:hypothetical protein
MTAEGSARLRAVSSATVSSASEEVVRYAGLDPERRELLLHVHELLEEIAFGTVVIVLQDGKVIQIETSEKIRLR